MKCRVIPPTLLLILLAQASVRATTYYVDGETGDDTHPGTAAATAWKSLERVNSVVFQPGDAILFKTGTRYGGQFKPQGSGRMDGNTVQPITAGSYGRGNPPRIDGEGLHPDAVLLRNVNYWEVRDLEVTNLGANREPGRTGVRVLCDGFGVMRHIHLSGLQVHDVNGDLRKAREGCGIFFESRGSNSSHFEDLVIENCHLARTDRNGICQRSGRARSVGVVIRGNLLEDIGGDAIKPWGSNGALVEHNTVRGARRRCEDAAAGIWPWDSDDTVIQFNEVSGVRGVNDGQGFDSDYRCRNSIFQYNYSHDNDGGFMLICSPGDSYCEGTIIRYNISQNDGSPGTGVFHFGGGARNTRIYNNLIYTGAGRDLPLLRFTEWSGGNAKDTYFDNNIFYVDGRVSYQWGGSANNVFRHNVFYGRHEGRPEDAYALTDRPPLPGPGSGGNGFDSLDGYRLPAGVAFASGTIIESNGGRDFFGNRLPPGAAPTIGVCQTSPR